MKLKVTVPDTKKTFQGIKRFFKNGNAFTLACAILVLIICFAHSLEAQIDCDFYPTNGTFQNFNPIRRLLDGQTPFLDFSVYLGVGHLYLGGFLTALFGGTYAASLSAFSFLTLLSFALISTVAGYAILGSLKRSLPVTLLLLIALLTSSLVFQDGIFKTFGDALNASLSPGNSARFIRGSILPICLIIIICLTSLVKKARFFRDADKDFRSIALTFVCSIAGAICFIFSNDYGLCSWLCICIMIFIIAIAKKEGLLKSFGLGALYIAVSGLLIIIIVTLITCGNPISWFDLTFGTGGYQSWYFNVNPQNYYLNNLDYSFLSLLQFFVFILYLIQLVKRNASNYACVRFGIPALMNMIAFCATNEYKLLTGNDLHEIAFSALFATLIFELIRAILNAWNKNTVKRFSKLCAAFVFCAGIAWSVSAFTQFIPQLASAASSETYMEELGGDLPGKSEDIKAAEEFIGDADVFSTYSSGLEGVTGQFQPSKFDYIIHALGDDARQDYLQTFDDGNFKYATTVRESAVDFEHWIRDANWFFYRELYKNYHPVFANSYELFWEKNADGESHEVPVDKIDFDVEEQEDGSIVLKVNCDKKISGTADVNINYSIEKTGDFFERLLIWQECLLVDNTSPKKPWYTSRNSFRLPSQGNTFIPIHVVKGYGEVTLSSLPEGNTELILENAELESFFTVNYDFAEIVNSETSTTNDN